MFYKVRFINGNGETKGIPYTYFSDEELCVNDIVEVPARKPGMDNPKAVVVENNVPKPPFECKSIVRRVN